MAKRIKTIDVKVDWVEERVDYWWQYLLGRCNVPDDFNCRRPFVRYVDRYSKVAGQANRDGVTFNLNYALREGAESYDETVCHEVCHVFVARLKHKLNGAYDAHGSLWAYLFNVVCGVERGRYHGYARSRRDNVPEQVKAIRELTRLAAKLT